MSDIVVKSNEVKNALKEFIVTNFMFGQDGLNFDNNDSFLERGIIDSTGILELIGYLEDTYAISIEDDELVPENLDSVNAVDAFVRRKLNGEAGANS
ncbi:acyl carrier protein [Marispirochaeta aestuarii]|uniref:Acyl carrier protein n=1 Tax=Marispirochaeta aestuarii TaxID=1963862 RepID=A0A1Y1RUF7_9SPIO|nr:acyl carrier protein [Marispirochaeta aestuarii]ORC32664.1 acyl carrier protein [Marispirochaeta aestuarii]